MDIAPATLELEASKLAFTFAKDLCVQLITLSAVIIGVTVTFSKDLKKEHQTAEIVLLVAVWLLYMASIIFGVWCLMSIVGNLAPVGGTPPDLKINDNVRFWAKAQIIGFFLATGLFLIYGFISLTMLRAANARITPPDALSGRDDPPAA